MSRTPRNLAVPLLAANLLVLAAYGSGSGAAAGSGGDQKTAAQSGGLPGEHVHGVARDPGDGTVYLATHEGLFRYDKGARVRLGPVVDWMGFSIAGPGHFYASGHPQVINLSRRDSLRRINVADGPQSNGSPVQPASSLPRRTS